jgi:hypothetical protein
MMWQLRTLYNIQAYNTALEAVSPIVWYTYVQVVYSMVRLEEFPAISPIVWYTYVQVVYSMVRLEEFPAMYRL